MSDTVTLTRIQPDPDYVIEGATGRVFVIDHPAQLVDADGNVVGLEGSKHRRPIEPDASLTGESAQLKALAKLARSPEKTATVREAREA